MNEQYILVIDSSTQVDFCYCTFLILILSTFFCVKSKVAFINIIIIIYVGSKNKVNLMFTRNLWIYNEKGLQFSTKYNSASIPDFNMCHIFLSMPIFQTIHKTQKFLQHFHVDHDYDYIFIFT